MAEPAPSILIARPRTISKAMTARQMAADPNRLALAEVTSISSVKAPKGARIRKIIMAASRTINLYIVKIRVGAKEGKVKRIFKVAKQRVHLVPGRSNGSAQSEAR